MSSPGNLISKRYRLDRKLGQGSFGEVWSAFDERLRKRVALKLLKEPADAEAGLPMERRRLLREARAAGCVGHPNVVQVFDVEVDGAVAFLVMELLEGESLRERIGRGPLGVEEACGLFVQVVSAVGTVHAGGIIHRDLKPENVFLAGSPGPSPSAKVLDFGVAKVGTSAGAADTAKLTATGERSGTLEYMSPEQVMLDEDLDHRTDIWSLGMTLYECLSGKRPVRVDDRGQPTTNVNKGRIVPIENVVPGVPKDLARLLRRMLAHGASERLSDLREALSVLERHTQSRAPSFGAPPSLAGTKLVAKRRPWRRIALAAATVCLVSIGVALAAPALSSLGHPAAPLASSNPSAPPPASAPEPPRAVPVSAPSTETSAPAPGATDSISTSSPAVQGDPSRDMPLPGGAAGRSPADPPEHPSRPSPAPPAAPSALPTATPTAAPTEVVASPPQTSPPALASSAQAQNAPVSSAAPQSAPPAPNSTGRSKSVVWKRDPFEKPRNDLKDTQHGVRN